MGPPWAYSFSREKKGSKWTFICHRIMTGFPGGPLRSGLVRIAKGIPRFNHWESNWDEEVEAHSSQHSSFGGLHFCCHRIQVESPASGFVHLQNWAGSQRAQLEILHIWISSLQYRSLGMVLAYGPAWAREANSQVCLTSEYGFHFHPIRNPAQEPGSHSTHLWTIKPSSALLLRIISEPI